MNTTIAKTEKRRANIRPLVLTVVALTLAATSPAGASGTDQAAQPGQGQVAPQSGAIGDFGLE